MGRCGTCRAAGSCTASLLAVVPVGQVPIKLHLVLLLAFLRWFGNRTGFCFQLVLCHLASPAWAILVGFDR